MSRCANHRCVEPCFYCSQGVQPFVSTSDHFDAIEAELHRHRRVSGAKIPATTLNVPQAVAVIRDYALGDIVMLSPSLKALKEKYLVRPLALVTHPSLFDVLEGADYLDAQLPKAQYWNSVFYKTFDLCGAVETEAGGKLPVEDYLARSRPDNFARLLGVEGGADKFPVPVNPNALSKMQAIMDGHKWPLIGIAPTCGSPVRVMPPEYVEPLVDKIQAVYGGTVVLLGKTKEWNRDLADLRIPGVINLIDTLSVAELISAVSLMNAMVSPDTGTMHVAGALEVKCLCLMGNNNPKIFSDFYSSVKVLQPTELPCVPCNDRSIPCTPLPKGQYGAECMRLMTPERVHDEFLKFYNGKNIAYLHDTPLTYEGGAELATRQVVKEGRKRGYNVKIFDSNTVMGQFHNLYNYDLIVLSNIWRFSKEAMNLIMKAIKVVPYVKYETDNDGLGDNPQGKYPRDEYAKKIYGNSILNIFQSPDHKKNFKEVFRIDGVCMPPMIDLNLFKNIKVKRDKNTALIAVPGKWDKEKLDDYIRKQTHLKVDVLIERVSYKHWPALLSQYEYFVHIPQRKWPCDRVIYEAALCGCKVVAGVMVEAMSWDKDLTDLEGLMGWLEKAPDMFWKAIATSLEGGRRVWNSQ